MSVCFLTEAEPESLCNISNWTHILEPGHVFGHDILNENNSAQFHLIPTVLLWKNASVNAKLLF